MDVIFVLGGGIGNIVQATPAVQATASEGHNVDLRLHCNSSCDLDIFNLSCVRNLFVSPSKEPKIPFDYQLNGPFTPGIRLNSKRIKHSGIHYAQHIPEANVYYDLAKQAGITTPMPDAKINLGNQGRIPESNTVAIYPGSKPDWAMKRWDKYDLLAKHFKRVVVVGKKEDIYSHGNPTWIKRPWDWPSHVEFFTGGLQETAYFISKCSMFVGNDGGLSHVAAATGIPTYVLFGPSSDVKNKPFSSNAHVIAINLPCRPCQFTAGPDGKQIFGGGKYDCPVHMKCMKDMSVDFVLEEIKQYGGVYQNVVRD